MTTTTNHAYLNHVDLDVMNEDEIIHQCTTHKVALLRLAAEGPAHWPYYRFIGRHDVLISFMVDVYSIDADDAEFMIERGAGLLPDEVK